MQNDIKKIYNLFVSAAVDFGNPLIPEWISKHPGIESKKKLFKIFPSLGLKNFIEPVEYAASTNKTKNVKQVLDAIADKFIDLKINLNIVKVELPEESAANKPILELRLLTQHLIMALMQQAKYVEEDSKIIINTDIKFENRIIIRSNESVFKLFGKINKLIDKLISVYPEINDSTRGINIKLPDMDSLIAFKRFSEINIGKKQYFVVFSSDGAQGAWDISTMSMRGIESCQSWNGSNKECLIGSILSKYVGIIYLTSGSQYENMGSKMLKRCIVRFGIDKKTKEKLIILDQMYDTYSEKVSQLFIEALKKHTNIKIVDHSQEFLDGSENIFNVEIPNEYHLEQKIKPQEYSYRDNSISVRQKNLKSNPTKTNKPYIFINKIHTATGIDIANKYMDKVDQLLLADKIINMITNKIREIVVDSTKYSVNILNNYIIIKTNKTLNDLLKLNIEQIIDLLSDSTENIEYNYNINKSQIYDIFSYCINIYSKNFNEKSPELLK